MTLPAVRYGALMVETSFPLRILPSGPSQLEGPKSTVMVIGNAPGRVSRLMVAQFPYLTAPMAECSEKAEEPSAWLPTSSHRATACALSSAVDVSRLFSWAFLHETNNTNAEKVMHKILGIRLCFEGK